MSDVQSQNTQIQTPATPATPAGPSMEELQAKVADLEKAREGLIRDVQHERSKRQELEQRIPSAPAPSAATTPDVVQDELGKVLNPYMAPVLREVKATKAELEQMRLEKAQTFLSEKMGKTWASIEGDREFQDRLLSTARKYGITGNVYETTVRAYELVQLEDLRAKETERVRQVQASQAQTMPSGTPPAPVTSSREYSVEDFNKMPLHEFDKLSQAGGFRKVGDKFVYSPKA